MKKSYIFTDLRRFLILWGSQAVSSLGTAMTSYALIIWVYGQKGTASSITLLSVFSMIPSILFAFAAGTLADRWNKKLIMLVSDSLAALGTVTVLVLYGAGRLTIGYLYVVNFVLSFMNAFQGPASYVATTLLVPKKHYVGVSGLQALSGSVVTILAPALGSALLAFGGLKAVLVFDLGAFALAFIILLFFVKIPSIEGAKAKGKESFVKSAMAGVNFLKNHRPLLQIILFFAFINFISKMGGGYGMMAPLVLARTGNNQISLGMVEAAVGLGTLLGSIIVTLIKPAKSRVRVIFIACGLSFLLGDVGQSLTHTLPLWVVSAFVSNVPMAFLNANLTALMRTKVPLSMQGRVFSARDTIQYSTIPLGLFLGGVLADYVFEPLMMGASPLQRLMAPLVGTSKGAGIALMFLIVGLVGFTVSFIALKNSLYQSLDDDRAYE